MPVAIIDPNDSEIALGIAKTPRAIQLELLALSLADRGLIETDITSGSPPKWSTFDDWTDLTVFAAFVAATKVGATQAEKMGGVAAYVLRHPFYLQHPAFAPSINIVPYV